MIRLIYALASVAIVSVISLIGIIMVGLNKKQLEKILIVLVSISAGALFGDAFIHLLPQAFLALTPINVAIFTILGILVFFVLEKFVQWRHCHVLTSKSHVHPVGYMNLIGDGFHNLIDGMMIGASYLVSIPIGLTTTIAIIIHEIPQEIGDYGVLLHAGFTKAKALLFNFLSASVAIVGTILAYAIGSSLNSFSAALVPFTAGGFIYIAGSDLIPELHKETRPSHSILQFISLACGIGLMLILLIVE